MNERVKWHTRGMRDLTLGERERVLSFGVPVNIVAQKVRAYTVASDLFGGPGETFARPSTWHETDVVHHGTIVAFDASKGCVLVKADDGTFASVPVVCVRAEARAWGKVAIAAGCLALTERERIAAWLEENAGKGGISIQEEDFLRALARALRATLDAPAPPG